jgi:mannose-binding lectin 1
VEQFDGLALVVDQYGGTGGKIRGFLNDGTQNFRAHSAPESLAFGHCDYRYRNLGRPSKLTVKSSQSGLEVKIDDRTCFSTSSVALPEGYHFGITASTGESNPDQIEVYKFQVSSNSGQQIRGNVNQAQDSGNQAQNSGNQPQSSPNKGTHKLDAFPGIVEAVPDRNAEDFKSQTEQFSDLHNRMQAMSHHIGNVFVELKTLAENSELQHKSVLDKHAEMIDAVSNMKASRDTGLPPETIRQIKDLSERVARMEASMAAVERSLERGNFEQLHHAVNSMGGLHETLPQHIKDGKLAILRVILPLANTSDF